MLSKSKKQYEIVYDRFNKRWTFKPKGLPGALKVASTRDGAIELAIPICSNQPCTLNIHNEAGQLEEERQFGSGSSRRR